MAMKTIKVYLKNCPAGPGSQIYCIKHQIGEDLTTFKEKIYKRCPSLRSAGDPVIYWFDLENDRIRISCDDDLKFFVEDAKITKMFWDFEKMEETRKRPSALNEDDLPKRLRTQMEQIDLSSDSSSMELSDDEEESVTSTVDELPAVASTSQSASEQINSKGIEIISVDIIKEAEKPVSEEIQNAENVEVAQSNQPVVIEDEEEVVNAEQNQQESSDNAMEQQQQRRPSDTNKIVISDSSDEEEDTTQNDANNRRFSDGNYSSSYSFADADINGRRTFTHSASFNDDFRRYNHHRRRRENFNEEARQTYRNCNENMHRMFQQAAATRDQAFRNFRNSANLIPDLLSTFQSHFRPLFQPPQPPRFNQPQFRRF